ncbi:NUDIX hydrolase [Nocardia miyunensis]|uniref:NUDIX hydrolase n=1 Tax=Nocardia miyunensis TaxID=282684 RepID=UPI00082A7CB0|nr:NUDIX domain-containing protein [Nocardia miyunensis]
MAIPSFLAELRQLVGTRLLWLPAVTAVVLDEHEQLLLNRRADDGRWSLVGGILDPGEQPADGVVRECFEETGLTVVPESLALVDVSPIIEYPSGDRCHYLELVFRCRPVAGHAHVHDEESLAVEWFPRTDLPDIDQHVQHRIDTVLTAGTTTIYQPPTTT